MPRKPIATVVAQALGDPQLRVTGYDGSSSGPADATVGISLRSPKALSYLITAPSSLGLARAFVSGELEIDGDLYEALSLVWSDRIGKVSWTDRFDALRNLDPKAIRLV